MLVKVLMSCRLVHDRATRPRFRAPLSVRVQQVRQTPPNTRVHYAPRAVLITMQSRQEGGQRRTNPEMHGVLAETPPSLRARQYAAVCLPLTPRDAAARHGYSDAACTPPASSSTAPR